MSTSRKIITCFVLCANLWLFGLAWFIAHIPRVMRPDDTHTDAIVVLTGGSGSLEYGLQLLEAGKGDKLFISGVSNNLTKEDILQHAPAEVRRRLEPMSKRIILGHEAQNTIGNAEETANWLKKENCHSIHLVTANYHMPRSIEEFEETAPGVTIIPSPVFPDDFTITGWWESDESRRLMLSEYHKYLASKLRHWLVSFTRRSP